MTGLGGRWRALVGLAALAGPAGSTAGCGDNAPAHITDRNQSVMVIDDGFDPTLPIFENKIAARYTIACDVAGAGGARGAAGAGGAGGAGGAAGADGGASSDAGDDLTAMKAALLAELSGPDESCRLQSGLTPVGNPFSGFSESQRTTWNAAMRTDQLVADPQANAQLNSIYGSLLNTLNALDSSSFHGTATASLVAHDWPLVQLILVQRPLESAGQEQTDFTCLAQADLDQAVALFSDPDVRAAFLSRPPATADQDLMAVRAQYGVGIVNESFGTVSRYGLELLGIYADCENVDLEPYFQVMGQLQDAYAQAHQEPGVLVVQAAGNDGALVNGFADSLDCHPDDPQHILVGSYGPDGFQSQFTNFGACVDVFAPGELVITDLPGDWLYPLSGTSFAAPLVVRVLSTAAPAPFAPATSRAYLSALREPSGNIPQSNFPAQLLYRPTLASRSGALVAAGGRATPPRPPGYSALALHRALWPVDWVRSRRNAR